MQITVININQYLWNKTVVCALILVGDKTHLDTLVPFSLYACTISPKRHDRF